MTFHDDSVNPAGHFPSGDVPSGHVQVRCEPCRPRDRAVPGPHAGAPGPARHGDAGPAAGPSLAADHAAPRRLRATLSAGLAVLLGLGLSALAPAPASAAPATPSARVCPTEDFVVGAGWGADRGRRAHLGIDLGGKRGTPIYAIEDGVIDRTKRQSNDALQIVMRGRSGAKFYYGHMDSVLVTGGQRVKAGDVIGLMGDTGSPGAVHLHFEFWRSGGESAAVDPEPLITRVCGLDGKRPAKQPPSEPEQPDPVAPEPDEPKAPEPDEAVAGEVFSN